MFFSFIIYFMDALQERLNDLRLEEVRLSQVVDLGTDFSNKYREVFDELLINKCGLTFEVFYKTALQNFGLSTCKCQVNMAHVCYSIRRRENDFNTCNQIRMWTKEIMGASVAEKVSPCALTMALRRVTWLFPHLDSKEISINDLFAL